MAGFLLKVLEWLTKPSHPVFLLFHYPPSRWLSGKESACQCRRRKRCGFNPWVGKVPCSRKWQSISVSLPGNPMNRGAWQAAVHGVTQSQTGLSTPTPTSSLFHLCSGFCRSLFLNWHAGLWPFSLSFIKHTHYDPPLCKVFWWWFHCLQTNIQTRKPLKNYSPTSKPESHLTITAHVTFQPEVLPYFISDTASLVTAIQTLLHPCAFAQAVCSTENVFSFFLQALSSMPAQENNGFGPAQTGFRFWLSTFELCCPEQVQACIYPVQSCLR